LFGSGLKGSGFKGSLRSGFWLLASNYWLLVAGYGSVARSEKPAAKTLIA